MEHEPRRRSDKEHEERLDRIEKTLARMENILTPISETYTTATTMGKWLTGFAVFVSIVIGAILGIIKIIHSVSK